MLVLTRKKNEVLLIGKEGEIKIRILNIEGNSVSVGITAPREIKIMREELCGKS